MKPITICQVIKRLYTRAVKEDRHSDIVDLYYTFLMAKRMHRKLVFYRYPGITQPHETESNWKKELKRIDDEYCS